MSLSSKVHSQSTRPTYDGAIAAARVTPLFVGPTNCAEATPWTWRFLKEWAPKLGVTVHYLGAKPYIVVRELLEALERNGIAPAEPAAPPEPGSVDELAAMRERLGMRRTGGAR
jgi:hypothetical protein